MTQESHAMIEDAILIEKFRSSYAVIGSSIHCDLWSSSIVSFLTRVPRQLPSIVLSLRPRKYQRHSSASVNNLRPSILFIWPILRSSPVRTARLTCSVNHSSYASSPLGLFRSAAVNSHKYRSIISSAIWICAAAADVLRLFYLSTRIGLERASSFLVDKGDRKEDSEIPDDEDDDDDEDERFPLFAVCRNFKWVKN